LPRMLLDNGSMANVLVPSTKPAKRSAPAGTARCEIYWYVTEVHDALNTGLVTLFRSVPWLRKVCSIVADTPGAFGSRSMKICRERLMKNGKYPL
jgi:hypothetical protein